jgi:CBS domain-containing protein
MTATKTDVTAKDVMTHEPVCVEPSTTIRQLARVLDENGISGAPVVDGQRRVIGVVSRTDLMRRCSEGTPDHPPGYLFEVIRESNVNDGLAPEALLCVEDFMTRGPVTVPPETPARAVARRMFEGRIHRVIVIDRDKRPVGIITSLDLLGVL